MTYTQEAVEKEFADAGCKLLTHYINSKTRLNYIAKCGHEASTANLTAFRRKSCSRLCARCSPKKTYTPEEVHSYVESQGCELLELRQEGKYKVVHILCKCGHEHTLKFEKFCRGQGRICPVCSRPRGEGHANYNPELTDEDRLKNRDVWENVLWRNDVFKRDEYRCRRCNDAKGGNLEAHHLNGWNVSVAERFVLSNGITLCKTCHADFHHRYGYGSNTREQFLEWIKDDTEVTTETKESVAP